MQAAQRQGKAEEMRDKIFENMRNLADSEYQRWAGEFGLDVARFKADFESGDVKAEVESDSNAGKNAGVSGTPTIFVNGRRYSGPRSLAGFKPVVDEEIQAADALIKSGTPLEKVYEIRSKANAK